MSRYFEDESKKFWENFSHDHLAAVSAILHKERRDYLEKTGFFEVNGARKLISNRYIEGVGIEVGAGDRPFPIPSGATVTYGDIRDRAGVENYFSTSEVSFDKFINGETFDGIKNESLDFIISAHVLEHLKNPFGSIMEGMKRLKPSGIYLLAVPDKRYTFDHNRPLTDFDHLMEDYHDGGTASLLDAYIEHVEYVHPIVDPMHIIADKRAEAKKLFDSGADIHVHTWTYETLKDHLSRLGQEYEFELLFSSFIVNEGLYVLQK